MTTPRLHVGERLAPGATLRLEAARAHYVANVLRLKPGAPLLVFNGDDGEWRATLASAGRRDAALEVQDLARPPAPEPGPVLHFAPIRRSRLDWMVEKAVELGVGRLVPVLTERTVVRLENPDRLRAIALEAAEQCGRLSVPAIDQPRDLGVWLAARDPARPLLMADEAGGDPLLRSLAAAPGADLLVGPEGGFAPGERALLRAAPGVVPVSLGPRILRAETAALALLAAREAANGSGQASMT